MKDMQGKVALVTGGSRGIGRAICEKLASRGADIAFFYSGNDAAADECKSAVTALGVKCEAYKCDVSDFDAVADTFAKVTEAFGTVDILVNNAGITRDKLVLRMSEEDFDSVIAVNLKGAFNLIKQAYPLMAKKRAGRIINISSVSGLVGNPGQLNYSASKAGLVAMTKTVAKELAARGVTCNAIAPGFVETDMTKELGGNNPLAEQIPMKRFGKPEEIASLCAFLASDDAAYITGEVIRCDGGLAM